MVSFNIYLGVFFFFNPIVIRMYLAGGVPESLSGWSAGAIWVGDGVAGGAPVSRSIGGRGEMGLGWGVGCIGLGGAPVPFGLGWGCRRCAGVWVNWWGEMGLGCVLVPGKFSWVMCTSAGALQ